MPPQVSFTRGPAAVFAEATTTHLQVAVHHKVVAQQLKPVLHAENTVPQHKMNEERRHSKRTHYAPTCRSRREGSWDVVVADLASP